MLQRRSRRGSMLILDQGGSVMGSFIRNLRFAHKFLFISVLAGLMLTVPTVIFVRVNLQHIAAAQLEVSVGTVNAYLNR